MTFRMDRALGLFLPISLIAAACAVKQPATTAANSSGMTSARPGDPIAVPRLNDRPGAAGDSAGVLTLAAAVDRALRLNPELKALADEIRIREGRRVQSGLLPNPELEAEVDEFGSTRGGGFNTAETTLSLGQLIWLGGKRARAAEHAARERDLAVWDYRAQRVDVMTASSAAFIRALAAQETLALARKDLELASRVVKTVSAKVDAGKVSAVHATRARVALSQSRIAKERAERNLATARTRLSALWGEETPDYARVEGDLESLSAAPPLSELTAFVEENPDVARWADERSERQARLELEQSRAIPDLKVNAGMKRFEGADAFAFVTSVSIPLPILDRNQGNIQSAKAGVDQAKHRQQSAETQTQAALAMTRQTLQSAYREALALREEVVAGARSAFELTEVAYKEGKFELIDVLDTQRTLFDAEKQYVEALADYHQARARLEGLIGRPIPGPEPSEN